MGPADRLDCYEINPDFAAYLAAALRREPVLAAAASRVRVHLRAAQDAASEEPADFVVCSIPLNNLDADTVRAILDRALSLLAAEGVLSYFEYLLLPRLRRLFASSAERARIDGVRGAKRTLRARPAGTRTVWWNLPPARAVHLRRIPTLPEDRGS